MMSRRWIRFRAVPRSVHVQLDDRSAEALDVICADGLDECEAVRMALQEAAARRRSRAGLRFDLLRDAEGLAGPD
jgi:hypothetical protein